MFEKEILIDDAGWGDLILGVVIGALSRTRRSHLKLSRQKYMERRIPTSSFQPPNFEDKRYLNDAAKIAEEIIEVMQPDEETHFKVCSGYALSSIRRYLRSRGFSVEEVEITGELQEMVERSYLEWCVEVGVPPERLEGERRFWTLLEWVAEKYQFLHESAPSFVSPMPDYSIPMISNEMISTGFAGLLGVLLTFILAWGTVKALNLSVQAKAIS